MKCVGSGAAWAYGDEATIFHQNGWGIWLYKQPFRHRINKFVFGADTRPVKAPKQPPAVIVGKMKHKHFQKKSKIPLPSLKSALPPCSQSLEFIQPVFSTWCLDRCENPSTSELPVVGCSPSTLKVLVAARVAFYAPIAGQSVGRDNSVVRFLRGGWIRLGPLPSLHGTCPLYWGPWRALPLRRYSLRTFSHCHWRLLCY